MLPSGCWTGLSPLIIFLMVCFLDVILVELGREDVCTEPVCRPLSVEEYLAIMWTTFAELPGNAPYTNISDHWMYRTTCINPWISTCDSLTNHIRWRECRISEYLYIECVHFYFSPNYSWCSLWSDWSPLLIGWSIFLVQPCLAGPQSMHERVSNHQTGTMLH